MTLPATSSASLSSTNATSMSSSPTTSVALPISGSLHAYAASPLTEIGLYIFFLGWGCRIQCIKQHRQPPRVMWLSLHQKRLVGLLQAGLPRLLYGCVSFLVEANVQEWSLDKAEPLGQVSSQMVPGPFHTGPDCLEAPPTWPLTSADLQEMTPALTVFSDGAAAEFF